MATDISKVGNHVMINDRLIMERPSFIEIGSKGADKVIIIRFAETLAIDDPIIKIPFAELTIDGDHPASVSSALVQLAAIFPGSATGGGGGGISIGDLSDVAISGDYDDLDNKPSIPVIPPLAPVATSGSYDDLEDKPVIPVIPDLAPVALSGSYNDLEDKPVVPGLAEVATSGDYNDLENKPVIPVVPDLAPVAISGSYLDLEDKPTIPPAPDLSTYVTETGAQSIEDKTINADLNDITNLKRESFSPSELEEFDPESVNTVANSVVKDVALGEYLFYDGFDRGDTSSGVLGTSTSGGTYVLLGAGLVPGAALSKIVGNRWVSYVDGVANQTTYAIQTFTEDVKNIGARWKWVTGNGGVQEAVMIFIIGQLGGVDIVYNAIHIRVTRANISFDFFVNGSSAGLTTKTITFPALIAQDREIFAEFTLSGETCHYVVAGHKGKVVDRLFASQLGKYATWEPFYNSANGVNQLSIASTWVRNMVGIGLDNVLASADGTQHPITGTLTETVLYSYTIPANKMGRNGYMRLEFLLSRTNNANLITVIVKIGTVGIGYVETYSASSFKCASEFQNRNSQILGISPHPSNNVMQNLGSAALYLYSAGLGNEVDWGVDQTVTVSVVLTDVADTAAVEAARVFIYQ